MLIPLSNNRDRRKRFDTEAWDTVSVAALLSSASLGLDSGVDIQRKWARFLLWVSASHHVEGSSTSEEEPYMSFLPPIQPNFFNLPRLSAKEPKLFLTLACQPPHLDAGTRLRGLTVLRQQPAEAAQFGRMIVRAI